VSHIADRFVVILDANVLYPFRMRDVLLQFHDSGLYRARWTDAILDEWARKLLEMKPHLAASIRRQQHVLRERFPEGLVTGYEALTSSLTLPDPDDRHVLAAAIRCGAQHIVTENLRDFPAETLHGFDIEPISADTFLSRTFDLYPTEALAALRTVRLRYTNPPFSAAAFVMDLTAKGLPMLAARAKQHMDFL